MELGDLRVELVVRVREALQAELDHQGNLGNRGTLVLPVKLECKDPREPQAQEGNLDPRESRENVDQMDLQDHLGNQACKV